jgi:hypothetical protein
MSDRHLWDEMCEAMKWHNHEHHCCIDTVNRLLQKHPRAKERGEIPHVARGSLNVAEESWELDRLWGLIHETQITDVVPNSTGPAIVVLRWKGVEYLMDGRRRINGWKRNGNLGPHRVLVLHHVNQGNDA